MRPPTNEDCCIIAAGRSWLILGKALSKQQEPLTERQLKNGAMRAQREIDRATKAYQQAVRSTPRLFYEQPSGPAPRYSTAAEANAHLLLIREDFITNRRENRAATIRDIRRQLARLPAEEVARLYTKWHKQAWAAGLEYLAGFLFSEERARLATACPMVTPIP